MQRDKSNLSIEMLVAGFCVKYARLNYLINEFYAKSTADKLSIYVDMNSVIKKLYSINEWGYHYKDQLELSASILNLCAHYRDFFRSRGVQTNFFIIYGNNCPAFNELYIKGYNNKFIGDYIKKKDITDMVNINKNTLRLITQYIPGIYFFDIGNNEVSAMIDYLLRYTHSAEVPDLESIILTKDILSFQLIPEHNVKVLRPFKAEEDESYIVDNSNLWEIFLTKYRKLSPLHPDLYPGFIQNVLPMSGVRERGMYSILSVTQAINAIYQVIQMPGLKILENNRLYSQSAVNAACMPLIESSNEAEIELRYKAINPRFQSSFVLLDSNPEFRTIRFTDIEDVKSLHDVMMFYFEDKGIPVDLNRL